MKLKIEIMPGSEAQVKVGILARAKLLFKNDAEVAIQVNDIMIRGGPNGPWVAYPSVKSNKKDEKGNDVYYPTVKFYPDDKVKFVSFTNLILGEYNKVVNGESQPSQPQTKAAIPKKSVVTPVPMPVHSVPKADSMDDLNFDL